ncbi:hypothetical protein AB6A40_009832 [Gnathostoma spinigerum]|uniref:Uncharacterized protein n=1 Tax=Gnathostoma spinigerum TaxID=75299 RepID=A0ABD6ET44_9BILA
MRMSGSCGISAYCGPSFENHPSTSKYKNTGVFSTQRIINETSSFTNHRSSTSSNSSQESSGFESLKSNSQKNDATIDRRKCFSGSTSSLFACSNTSAGRSRIFFLLMSITLRT